MKNTLLFFCLIASVAVLGQKLEFQYDFSDYRIEETQNYSLIQIDGTKNRAVPGYPVQPYYLSNVLLPQGATIENVTLEILSDKSFGLSSDLFPMQYARPLSDVGSPVFIKNEQAYQKTCVKTIDKSIVVSSSVMNGYEIAQVKFSPIEYNAKNRTVRLAQKTKLTIHYSMGEHLNASMVSYRPEVHKRLQLLCENPQMAKTYTAVKDVANTIDALIITPESFAAHFQPLVADYQSRGMSVAVLSIEQISTDYSGVDLQEKIRNSIIDYYQNHDVLYVLLGGDVEHVPHRGFYCEVQSSSVYEDENIPADLYYMALDGTWNDNENSLWGEIGEDDLLPEVALSRMPFSSVTDLANMINKTLSYSNHPVLGELTSPLLAGEHLYDDPLTWGAQYLDLIHGTHDDHGYTTSGIPEEHPFETMYDRDQSWNASDLIAEINSGHPFIHHVGHSNSDYAMRLYNSDITTSNFDPVDGVSHNFPIIYTHGCICGAFDDSDCIAEHMLQIDRFAVAFIGNSRYGWFNEGQTEGPSQHLHREFVNALYANKVHALAEAHLISKIQTAGWVEADGQHEYGAIRWVFYDCNALGAPALPMWTNEPRAISIEPVSAIHYGVNALGFAVTEDGNPAENVNLAIELDGVVIGSGSTNENGIVQIQLTNILANAEQIGIVYSGYNILKDTVYEDITAPEQGFLVVSAISFNEDEMPIYGHEYTLGLLFENVGQALSETTHVQVSCDNEWVQVQNSQLETPQLEALTQEFVQSQLGMTVSNTIPDGTPIVLSFDFYNDNEITHSGSIQYRAMAPAFKIKKVQLDDQAGGDANGIFDAGEVVVLRLMVANLGSVSPENFHAALTVTNSELMIINESVNLSNTSSGNDLELEFAVQAPPNLENTVLDGLFTIEFDSYAVQQFSFHTIIGQSIEDFETGDFSQYEWINDANHPWTITSNSPYAGAYSAQSGSIGHNQSTGMSISVDIPVSDSISFYYKVSCEGSQSSLWDYLEFSIDGVAMETWDNEIDWSRASFPVSEGTHLFKWKYSKDYSMSAGEDCAWIDNIVFPIPSTEIPTENHAPQITSGNQLNLNAGEEFTYTLTATDIDADNLTAAIVSAPPWVSIENIGETSWRISGIMPPAVEDLSYFILAVSDGFVSVGLKIEVSVHGMDINDNINDSEVLIYPQPSKTHVNVEWNATEQYEYLSIYNINGRLIATYNITDSNRTTINIQDYANGIYLLKLQSVDNKITVCKMVVH